MVDMVEISVKDKIILELDKLSLRQLQQILDFTTSLLQREKPQGVSGKSLLQFGGTIDKDDLDLMKQAIEEELEKIDYDQW